MIWDFKELKCFVSQSFLGGGFFGGGVKLKNTFKRSRQLHLEQNNIFGVYWGGWVSPGNLEFLNYTCTLGLN